MGRPSSFTESKAQEICERLSTGESLLKICESEDFPSQATVFKWLSEREAFLKNYVRAREFWADYEFEQMMRIADTPMIGVKTETDAKGGIKTIEGDMTEHRKLQVETRKWALARMNKRFTDRIENRLAGPEGEALKIVVTGIRPTEENSK